MLASRLADAITTAVWAVQTRVSLARNLARLWDRVAVLEDGQAVPEAVADITLDLAGHRTRIDAELTLLRERLDRYQREAGEREVRCVSRLTRHVQEHHLTRVGLKETT